MDVAAAARRGAWSSPTCPTTASRSRGALCTMLAADPPPARSGGWSRGRGWAGRAVADPAVVTAVEAWSGSAGSPVAWRVTSPRSAAAWWRDDPFLQPGPGLPPLLALPRPAGAGATWCRCTPLTARTRGLIGAAELATSEAQRRADQHRARRPWSHRRGHRGAAPGEIRAARSTCWTPSRPPR